MKFSLRLLAPLCAAVALFLSGCSSGDDHDKVLDDAAAQYDRMAKALASVTDKASAEKAGKEMKSIAEELKKTATRAQALGEPPVDVKAKVENKMRAIEAKWSQTLEAQRARVKALPADVTEAFKKASDDAAPAWLDTAAAFKKADKK